jgi:hypothetical protein
LDDFQVLGRGLLGLLNHPQAFLGQLQAEVSLGHLEHELLAHAEEIGRGPGGPEPRPHYLIPIYVAISAHSGSGSQPGTRLPGKHRHPDAGRPNQGGRGRVMVLLLMVMPRMPEKVSCPYFFGKKVLTWHLTRIIIMAGKKGGYRHE